MDGSERASPWLRPRWGVDERVPYVDVHRKMPRRGASGSGGPDYNVDRSTTAPEGSLPECCPSQILNNVPGRHTLAGGLPPGPHRVPQGPRQRLHHGTLCRVQNRQEPEAEAVHDDEDGRKRERRPDSLDLYE